MNLQVGKTAPRACGDGPSSHQQGVIAPACSPRLRGWTQGGGAAEYFDDLLPAPAGMDPKVPMASVLTEPAPRACGDGPSRPRCCLTVTCCSPRPRGWTLIGRQDARRRLLLPAPAGMVPTSARSAWTSPAAPCAGGDGPAAAASRVLAWNRSPRSWGPSGLVPEVGRAAPRARRDGPTAAPAPWSRASAPRA
jgi:hypothetical protein